MNSPEKMFLGRQGPFNGLNQWAAEKFHRAQLVNDDDLRIPNRPLNGPNSNSLNIIQIYPIFANSRPFLKINMCEGSHFMCYQVFKTETNTYSTFVYLPR